MKEIEVLILNQVKYANEGISTISILDSLESKYAVTIGLHKLHTLLNSLELNGYIKSEMKNPTVARGNRKARYFHLTSIGKEKLTELLTK